MSEGLNATGKPTRPMLIRAALMRGLIDADGWRVANGARR